MSKESKKNADVKSLLGRLTEPAIWGLLNTLGPAASRRIMFAILQETHQKMVAGEARARYVARLEANARQLGFEPHTQYQGGFAERHFERQHLRQTEEMMSVFGNIPEQIEWIWDNVAIRGLGAVIELIKNKTGAVIAGAHTGPTSYCPIILPLALTEKKVTPRIVSVINAPTPAVARAYEEQTKRFDRFHDSTLQWVAKNPGGELQLVKKLTDELTRGALVVTRFDVLTGGLSRRAVDFFGLRMRLPGAFGAAQLAHRAGVPLFPVRTIRSRTKEIEIEFLEPLYPDAKREETAQHLATLLERWVREDPADWAILPNLHQLLETHE